VRSYPYTGLELAGSRATLRLFIGRRMVRLQGSKIRPPERARQVNSWPAINFSAPPGTINSSATSSQTIRTSRSSIPIKPPKGGFEAACAVAHLDTGRKKIGPAQGACRDVARRPQSIQCAATASSSVSRAAGSMLRLALADKWSSSTYRIRSSLSAKQVDASHTDSMRSRMRTS
jgi:hypothetical protein